MPYGIKVEAAHNKKLGAWSFTFQYPRYQFETVKATIGILKVIIPSSDRVYEPVAKEWTITDKFWPKVKEIFLASGFNISEKTIVAPEDFFYNDFTSSATVVSKESLAEQLVKMLNITMDDLKDSNLAKKAYRKAAIMWHPDKNNGDGSKMSELNSIWSAYNAS